jgi:hypothetical protein
LTIYNNDAQTVSFASLSIEALTGTASFVYISGNWRLVSKNNTGWLEKGNSSTTPSNSDPVLNQKANNNFIGTIDTNDLVFTTNGYERMRIKSGASGILGKIGIGTKNPIGKLSIVEEEDITNYPALYVTEKNMGDAVIISENGEGNALNIYSTGNGLGIYTNLNNPPGYTGTIGPDFIGHSFLDSRTYSSGPTGNKIGMVIENEGSYNGNNIGLSVKVSGGNTNTAAIFNQNVGIGRFDIYSIPNALLDMKTPNVIPTSTSPGMLNILSSETSGAADLGGSISLGGYRFLNEFRTWGSIEGRKENSSTVNNDGYLVFKTNAGSLQERMRINSDGNIGVGTSSPLARFDIVSNNDVTGSTLPGNLNVRTLDSGGAADVGGAISLGGYRSTATDNEARVYGTIEGRKSTSLTTSSSGYLMFKTSNAGNLSERMRIFEDGAVRINDLSGTGIRVVTAGTNGTLGAVGIGTLEIDPSWNETANIVGATGLLTRAGRVLTNASFVNGTSISTASGLGTGADNQYHNIPFSASQTAMTGISIYCTGTHLDGDIKIFGIAMTDLLTTTTGWYGLNAGVTSAGSATNTVGTGADDQYHTAQCPNNRIATGIEIYASGALDGNMKLRCNSLTSGYSTSETGIGIESLINTPFNDANNITHMSTCPAGTFVKGIRIYASSRLDNQVQVFCTGITKN